MRANLADAILWADAFVAQAGNVARIHLGAGVGVDVAWPRRALVRAVLARARVRRVGEAAALLGYRAQRLRRPVRLVVVVLGPAGLRLAVRCVGGRV